MRLGDRMMNAEKKGGQAKSGNLILKEVAQGRPVHLRALRKSGVQPPLYRLPGLKLPKSPALSHNAGPRKSSDRFHLCNGRRQPFSDRRHKCRQR